MYLKINNMAFVRERSCGAYLQKRKDHQDINLNYLMLIVKSCVALLIHRKNYRQIKIINNWSNILYHIII